MYVHGKPRRVQVDAQQAVRAFRAEPPTADDFLYHVVGRV